MNDPSRAPTTKGSREHSAQPVVQHEHEQGEQEDPWLVLGNLLERFRKPRVGLGGATGCHAAHCGELANPLRSLKGWLLAFSEHKLVITYLEGLALYDGVVFSPRRLARTFLEYSLSCRSRRLFTCLSSPAMGSPHRRLLRHRRIELGPVRPADLRYAKILTLVSSIRG